MSIHTIAFLYTIIGVIIGEVTIAKKENYMVQKYNRIHFVFFPSILYIEMNKIFMPMRNWAKKIQEENLKRLLS